MFTVIKTNTFDSLLNRVFMKNPPSKYVRIICSTHEGCFSTEQRDIDPEHIAIPDYFRRYLQSTLKSQVLVIECDETEIPRVDIKFSIKILGNANPSIQEVISDAKKLKPFLDDVIIEVGCEYYYMGVHTLPAYLVKCEFISLGITQGFINEAKYTYTPKVDNSIPIASIASISRNTESSRIVSRSNYNETSSLFNGDFDFEKLGIGGQGDAFKLIFRTAFAPYLLEEESKSMGNTPIKGILLYGPPGCGKTLIARQLAKCVNAKTFKIINGPEIKDKYVGESERYIRELFKEAEESKEREEKGIHVLVFDEFDSIAIKRNDGGSVGSNMGNDIVNQLLSKIDGVDQLDNILIIGMTNRKSAIDPAILRSGRLELHIEITVPDRIGRLEIFNIHSKDLVKNGHLCEDVNFDELSERTVNYSGAEIKALINKASTYPMVRLIDPITMKKNSSEKPIITRDDFLSAINEIVPVMGSTCRDVQIITRNPISLDNVEYKRVYDFIKNDLIKFFTSRETSAPMFVEKQEIIGRNFSILLLGRSYSGKTKMISHIVSELSYIISHLRFINPEYYINNNSSLWREFDEGKRTDNFLMVIDSLEIILDSSLISKEVRELKTILGCTIETEKLVSTIVTCSDPALISSFKLQHKFMRTYNLDRV